MVQIKRSEIRIIDDAFDMHGGYVLDFSDRTMREYFEDEFGIEIYQEKYAFNGSSKAKHLRAFIATEDAVLVCRVLRSLWNYRQSRRNETPTLADQGKEQRLFELLSRLESNASLAPTDAIDRFKKDETLEELVSAIHRDIAANKPASALDRLHTYCMKKFAHLLDARGVSWDRDDPLHSRVGKYVKALEQDKPLHEITRRIVKSSISVFEQFNDVRNNKSFAHDNAIVEHAEARFIFDSIHAFLRFVIVLDGARFGA